MQHERKPIIDKKEFSNNTSTTNYNSNALNKIYIRKDLSSEANLLPSPFPCDLGLPLFKRMGKQKMCFLWIRFSCSIYILKCEFKIIFYSRHFFSLSMTSNEMFIYI